MRTKIITIEDREIVIAPTPMSKLAEATSNFSGSGTVSAPDIHALCESLWWGIKRATPDTDITVDWLEMNIDVHNIAAVMTAFNEINGSIGAAASNIESTAQHTQSVSA